jgi:glutamate racemase
VLLLCALSGTGAFAQVTALERMGRLAQRDSLRVLVTDSGLGGLAVCADIEARARSEGGYRVLEVIFANALPEVNCGYNRMRSTEEKVRVFDDALHGMERWYAPDLILVACNTLSVLIPQTRFAAAGRIPVLGIVETGVGMMLERLRADTASTAIIFGTETTVSAGTHRTLLEQAGVLPERIVMQACPDLAGAIETDARSDAVETAIDLFVEEAVEQCPADGSRVVAGLCCTHYGYRRDRFTAALGASARGPVDVVDPNDRMSDVLFPAGKGDRPGPAKVSVQVVSRAVITQAEVASIGTLVEQVSAATAAALRAYTLKRDLFPFASE